MNELGEFFPGKFDGLFFIFTPGARVTEENPGGCGFLVLHAVVLDHKREIIIGHPG